MRDLSIFVDESGDTGTESKYYLITLVLHEQDRDLHPYEKGYQTALLSKGLEDIPLHLSPLINGHGDYEGMPVERRKRHLAAFRVFMQKLPYRYVTFAYRKSELSEQPLAPNGAVQRIRRDLACFLLENLEYLQRFDSVKVYYDDGQALVTKALHDAIGYALSKEAIVYRDAPLNATASPRLPTTSARLSSKLSSMQTRRPERPTSCSSACASVSRRTFSER